MPTDLDKLKACVSDLDDRINTLDDQVATLEASAIAQACHTEALKLALKSLLPWLHGTINPSVN